MSHDHLSSIFAMLIVVAMVMCEVGAQFDPEEGYTRAQAGLCLYNGLAPFKVSPHLTLILSFFKS